MKLTLPTNRYSVLGQDDDATTPTDYPTYVVRTAEALLSPFAIRYLILTMSVVGVDFGLQNALIAAARRGGVDVLLNGSSNRLNPCMVSFERCRSMGEVAAMGAMTNYRNTISNMKRLIGLSFDDPRAKAEMKLVSFTCVPIARAEGGRSSIGVEVELAGETKVLPIEVVAGMMVKHLGYIAAEKAASTNAGLTKDQLLPQDWVIAIPNYYTDSQRRAFLAGCESVGVTGIQRLMHESTATALAYGIFKDIRKEFTKDKPTNVMFIDMGASSYTVAIAAFEPGKLIVKSAYCDADLGGRDIDQLIAEWIAKKFEKKFAGKLSGKPTESVKTRLKLLAAAEKAKKTLSPQGVTEARINLECLMDELDFIISLTADEYEKMSAPLLARLGKPIQSALDEAKLTASDMASIEIVGGSTRIDCIKRALIKILGQNLSTTMNADESVARGAALQSAILSPRFKVLPYEIQEAQPFPVKISWGEEFVTNSVVMFDRGLNFPIVRRVTLRRSGDFVVKAAYDESSVSYGLPETARREIATFKIKMPAAEDKKVRVNVKLDLHGIITLSSAKMIDEVEGEPTEVEVTDLEFTLSRPLNWTEKAAFSSALESTENWLSQEIIYYKKALSIQEQKAPDSLDLAKTYYNLGFVCDELSQKISYYKKALSIFEQKAPDSWYLANTNHHLGILFDKTNQPNEAKQHHNKAFWIQVTSAEDSMDWANAFVEWADDYCEIGNAEEAVKYHSLALNIYTRKDANHPNVAKIQEKMKSTGIGAVRVRLRNVMLANGDADPVEIPLEYVNLVNTNNQIGQGYFGAVFMGYDDDIKASFAIKVIHEHLLQQSNTQDIEHARKTFQQEIETLRQFHHPHIAKLFGYHLSDDLRSNVSLIFELAEKGSLDKFWADDFGRSQLSWKQRLQIGLDVATALSYLHNGGDGIKACYHRDIKSANICLNRNFQGQLIDCGLAKFVTEDDLAPASSASKKVGTPGYICPLYQSDAIPYGPKCEVFSFGVILTELIIGRLQNFQETPSSKPTNFALHYVTKRHKNCIEDSFDKLAGDWEPNVISELSALVLQCMDTTDEDDRPSMLEVVEKLQMLVSDYCHSHLKSSASHINFATSALVDGICRMCMIQSDSCLPCNKVGSPPHLHCKICLDRHVRNRLGCEEIRCPLDGCDSEPFSDEQLCDVNTWSCHVVIRSNNKLLLKLQSHAERIHKEQLNVAQKNHIEQQDAIAQNANELHFTNMTLNELQTRTKTNHIEHMNVAERHHSKQIHATAQNLAELQNAQKNLDDVRGMMISVYAKVVERCPRLFVLVQPDKLEPVPFYSQEWMTRMTTVSARLYFVCAHSRDLVEPPIQLTVTKEWWKIAQPAINSALAALKSYGVTATSAAMVLVCGIPITIPIHIPKVGLMGKDDNVKDLVRTSAKTGAPDEQTAEELLGKAYELIADKAQEDGSFYDSMSPVFMEGEGVQWVLNKYKGLYQKYQK